MELYPVAESTGRVAKGEFPLRVFFGHHKCATGWIDGVLMEVCFHMGINFRIVHRPPDFGFQSTLSSFVKRNRVDFLAYTNADIAHVQDLPFFRGFHVVRDPRDVIVSAYFSHLHSHPTDHWSELQAHRKRLQGLPKEEGLFCEMEFSRPVLDEMYRWEYGQNNVLELRMEDLTADPATTFREVMRFLEILDYDDELSVRRALRAATLRMNRLNQKGRRFMPGHFPMFPVPRRRLTSIPEYQLAKVLRMKSFSRLSGGRDAGQENVQSHYRKGQPGDWKNHFSDAHKHVFKQEYNALLVKLGYETGSRW